MSWNYLLVLSLFLSPENFFSQARLVLAGNSYIVIDNAAKVVVENQSAGAIVQSGTGGIMTESEVDQLVWKIGAATGNYVVPFVSQAPITQIPFTVNITTAGTGTGQFFLSTYPGAVADNNTYRPSDVTHMFDYTTGSVNNSDHVIDRFWIADASGYGTKPAATLQFTYRDQEHLQGGNAIIEGGLGAQRFNSVSNIWGDYLPQGTTNVATNTTSGVPVSPANFFRSWTLSELLHPLAAELNYFQSVCSGPGILLSWQTSSETAVDHFEIEYHDQQQFTVIGFVQPSGPGGGISNYSFRPVSQRSGTFRLVEVTTDGERVVRSLVSASCGMNEEVTVSYNSDQHALLLGFNGESESEEYLELYDAGGKVVFRTAIPIAKGMNSIVVPDLFLSTGMYIVRLKNGQSFISKKVNATH